MPGFCASIVLAFIWGVKLFDYVVDRGNLLEPGWGRKPNGGYGLKMGGSNPQDATNTSIQDLGLGLLQILFNRQSHD